MAEKTKTIIFITGSIASGKTTLLSRLYRKSRRNWNCCGIISEGTNRQYQSQTPSNHYDILILPEEITLLWAERDTVTGKFQFNDDTCTIADNAVTTNLHNPNTEICFLDEIGKLELQNLGFSNLFRKALESTVPVIVATVRKGIVEEVADKYKIESYQLFDLDEIPPRKAYHQINRSIATIDSEKIGVYAGAAGAVEVSLGSALHAYRVPMKGHFLAYIQSMLLVSFGKQLHGRGLVRISFVTSMLKAFSPMGSVLMPMLYIFVQGSIFAAPVALFGWSLFTAGVGAILMAWLTLIMSLVVDYVMFGKSIFDAFAGVVSTISHWFGVNHISLVQVITGLLLLKAFIAMIVTIAAYYTNIVPRIRQWVAKKKSAPDRKITALPTPRKTIASVTWGALRDFTRLRFLLSFIVSILLIYFFAKLSSADLALVLIRAICVSYLTFLLLRSVDILKVSRWIDKKFGLGLEKSFPAALSFLTKHHTTHSKPHQDDPSS